MKDAKSLAELEVARVNEVSLDEVGEFATDLNLYLAGFQAALESQEVRKLLYVVGQYYEYFEAIRNGEYEKNRRPAPLRDFEDVLQLSASDSRKAFDALADKGEK